MLLTIFASEKVRCTECAQCCKGTKSIGIHKNERKQDEIVLSATLLGATALNTHDGTALVFPKDRCSFLTETKIAGVEPLRQTCSIYATRPWACTMYPFVLNSIATADGTIQTIVALTASCPPVAELLAKEVNWIEPRECVTYEEREIEKGARQEQEFKRGVKYFVPVFHIPFLGNSLWPLIRVGNEPLPILSMISGKSEIEGYFLKDEKERSIIPILGVPPFLKRQTHF